MILLSSRNKKNTRIIFFTLAICLLCSACQASELVAKAEPTRGANRFDFQRYGYEVSGFTAEQEQLIAWSLSAYGRALGEPEKLRKIILEFNHGKNWKIVYRPRMVGANASIKLSPTVFSLEKSRAANYSCYAAPTDATHARVVISHEINHTLLQAVKDRTGVDWSKAYQQRVKRDWGKTKSLRAPEEEAATEFGLKIQSLNYYFSIQSDGIEKDPEIIAEIDGWTADFLIALKEISE